MNTKLPRHESWGFKSSRSAIKWVTVHQFTNLLECITAVKANYDHILTTCLSNDAVSLYEVDFNKKSAIIFGNEQNGISEELAQFSDGNFVIPQVGMLHSLNISVACAVTLYEAFRQKKEAGHYRKQKWVASEFKTLSNQWGLYDENNK